jgi:hypothetical protein
MYVRECRFYLLDYCDNYSLRNATEGSTLAARLDGR